MSVPDSGLWVTALFFGIPLALVDIFRHRLPNILVASMTFMFLVVMVPAASTAEDWPRLTTAMGIGVGAFILYALVGMAGLMGFGDVKLAGALGLWLGWYGMDVVVIGMLAAFVLALPQSIVVTIRAGRGKPKKRLAFGPYLLGGAVLALLWAPTVQFMGGASLL